MDGKYRRDRRRQTGRSRFPVVPSYVPVTRSPSTEEVKSIFEVILPTSNLQVEVQNPEPLQLQVELPVTSFSALLQQLGDSFELFMLP